MKIDLLSCIENLNMWKSGKQRAPHKPLLLLLALSKVAEGKRLLSFENVVYPELQKLLKKYGPPRRIHHPEYPFTRLEETSDADAGFWELRTDGEMAPEKRKDNKNELIRVNAHGGFKQEIFDDLSKNTKNIELIASGILSSHFPNSIAEDICEELNFNFTNNDLDFSSRRRRDPDFRRHVLRAYRYKCAATGWNLQIGADHKMIGLEAAHIFWHSLDGPDTIDNGICFCKLAHNVFDNGGFSIDENFCILISPEIHGTVGLDLLDIKKGKSIKLPERKEDHPNQEYLAWHREEVFQGYE
ncbi:HNH endonuclease [PVC group bacterium]|nr:HNH endonuclease [PVC group bacterium]